MSFQPGANLYTQGFGSRPESVEVPHIDVRDPSSTDVLYPIGKTWINTALQSMFFLSNFTSSNGVTSAQWIKLEDVTGAFATLSDTANVKVYPDGTGNIKLNGVANQTNIVSNPGSNRMDLGLPTAIITPGSLEVTNGFTVDDGRVDIETGINGFTLNKTSIGDIEIGQTTAAQAVTILAGSGGVNIDSVSGSTINIGDSLLTDNNITIGNSNTVAINEFCQSLNMGGFAAFNANSGFSSPTSIGGSPITVTSQTGASLNIDITGNVSLNQINGSNLSLGNSPTSGQIYLGNVNMTGVTIDGGNVSINNTTGNGNVQIGNVTGIGSTSIDSGSDGVFILNTSGNNNTLVMGPYLPNGTSGNIEINPGDTGGRLLINGGISFAVSGVAGAGVANISQSQYMIPCDSTAGIITIGLPPTPNTGQSFVIADISGAAVANNITIDGVGKTINGSGTLVINQAYGMAILYYTGSVWAAK